MKLFCALFFVLVGCVNSVKAADDPIVSNRPDSDQYGHQSVIYFLEETKKVWDTYAKTTKRPSVRGVIRALKKADNGAILFNNISISNADNMVMVVKVEDNEFEFEVGKKKLKKLINALGKKVEEPSKLFPLINETVFFGKKGLMEVLCALPESSVAWIERKLSFEDFELKTINKKKVKVTEKVSLKFLQILTHLKDKTIKIFKEYVIEAKKIPSKSAKK